MKNSEDKPQTNFILRTRLQGFMVFRVVLAIAFLGAFIWFQLRGTSTLHPSLYPLYAIIIATLGLTILYALLFQWIKNLKTFTYAQVFIDILLITTAVYVTGGMESLLSILYTFSIISGGILLHRRGGFYSASVSSIAYGILMDMDFYGVIPQRYKIIFGGDTHYVREDFLITVTVNIMAFYTVAFLIGSLTERLSRVEKELEEKGIDFKRLEALNRYIVENINSGILTVDGEGRITSFNKGAERITGYLLSEVYYRRLDEVFPGLKGFLTDLSSDVSGFLPFREGRVYRRKDGEELYLGFSISPARDKPTSPAPDLIRGKEGPVPAGFKQGMDHIIIFQDLTRIKQMEERLRRAERLRALGELAAGMAHEVRNPLAAISGSIQVLKEGLMVDGEERHLMEIALRETDRLNTLITDFLLFARPAIKRVEVDIKTLLEEAIALFKNSPEASHLDITSNLEEGLFCEGESQQLKQAFWNLFLNAAQAMPEGGELKIESRSQKSEVRIPSPLPSPPMPRGEGDKLIPSPLGGEGEGEGVMVITISDTGEGIRPEDIEHIFDPFFTTKASGTGLGLALVHRIIEGHGGTIDVRSRPGKGTSFEIILPMAKDRGICPEKIYSSLTMKRV